jgi:hypothetical protein
VVGNKRPTLNYEGEGTPLPAPSMTDHSSKQGGCSCGALACPCAPRRHSCLVLLATHTTGHPHRGWFHEPGLEPSRTGVVHQHGTEVSHALLPPLSSEAVAFVSRLMFLLGLCVCMYVRIFDVHPTLLVTGHAAFQPSIPLARFPRQSLCSSSCSSGGE